MKEKKEKNGLVWYEWFCPHRRAKQIELTGEGVLSDSEVAKFKAEFLGDSSYEILAQEDLDIYAPENLDVLDLFSTESKKLEDRLLISFRKRVFSKDLSEKTWKSLRGAARKSKNRGVAGGKVDFSKITRDPSKVIIVGDGTRYRYITDEGVLSDTYEANETFGGIAGFFSSTARNPYCRQTAYTKDSFEKFKGSFEFLSLCSKKFKELAPTRFSNQENFLRKSNLIKNNWVVPETVYTTITVNKNFQTACHQDSGDYKAGMENLVAFEQGDAYKGGYTVFPKFRVAVDVRQGDFVCMDVAHHWHGNTAIEPVDPKKEEFERLSLVLYVREDMQKCGTQYEEHEKYLRWKEGWKPPTEMQKDRLQTHLDEKQKDADFMGEFGSKD